MTAKQKAKLKLDFERGAKARLVAPNQDWSSENSDFQAGFAWAKAVSSRITQQAFRYQKSKS